MFGLSILLYILFSIARGAWISFIVVQATSNMHNKMAESVLRAPIQFFDTNPIGRILTRFSKDITMLDTLVCFVTPFIAYGVFRAVGVAIVLCVVNPWVLIPLAFALIYMMYTLKRNIFGLIES